MFVGSMDRQIQLRKYVITKDAQTNEEVKTVFQTWTLPCEKLPLKGQEQTLVSQMNSGAVTVGVTAAKFRIRYMPDVDNVLFDLVHEGRAYNIRSVTESVRRQEYLDLISEAVA